MSCLYGIFDHSNHNIFWPLVKSALRSIFFMNFLGHFFEGIFWDTFWGFLVGLKPICAMPTFWKRLFQQPLLHMICWSVLIFWYVNLRYIWSIELLLHWTNQSRLSVMGNDSLKYQWPKCQLFDSKYLLKYLSPNIGLWQKCQ